jgi:Subtilase family
MPVHYCLGLRDSKFAKLADPWDSRPLVAALPAALQSGKFNKVGLSPSYVWTRPGELCSHVIAQLRFDSHAEAQDFHGSLKTSGFGTDDYGFGQDPVISALDSWSPVGPGGWIFGDRDLADSLTGVAALPTGEATGEGVNVVIVDRGLSRDWAGETITRMAPRRGLAIDHPVPNVPGWTRYEFTALSNEWRMRRPIFPGATGSDHAQMIARNVLAIAPKATIWDAPLLPLQDEMDAPPRISALAHLLHWIKQAVDSGKVWSWDTREAAFVETSTIGRWIMVNAWGVLDPESDPELNMQGYADDPDHFLVNDVIRLDDSKIDVVFAAGNCGEPFPDRRCGSQDTGPGRSILGLNAHPNVLTVGAVRADGVPVALSAQGPGRLAAKGSRCTDYSRNKLAIDKPDLCAPSHFRESDDASETNTGTSAACGFAAGILAALRSVDKSKGLSPGEMRQLLRDTAQRASAGWDRRLGFGVINAEKALAGL